MASDRNRNEAYLVWASQGLARRLNQELADQFGISRATLYKWAAKQTTDSSGTVFPNWEARYEAETKESRETFEKAIKTKMEEGYKLVDVIMDSMLMEFALKVQDPKFKENITLNDIVKIVELSEKIHTRLDSSSSSEDTGGIVPNINFNVGFRSDTSE